MNGNHIKPILLNILLLFLLTTNLCGQVLLSDNEVNLIDYVKINPNFGTKSSSLQEVVSLKKYCPEPGNQGSTGSCASFAAVHGAINITNSLQNNIMDKSQIESIRMSSSFVYNQLNTSKNCSKGTSIIETLDFLTNQGTCFESEFPFTNDCSIAPDQIASKSKSNLKIDYSAVLYDKNSSDIRKENLVKNYLSDSIPVIAVCQISDNFLNLPYGTTIWEQDERRDQYLGHHVMVVIGYDDNTQTFELLNSWGNKWGNGGFVSISYRDFTSISTSGLILKVSNEAKELLNKVVDMNDYKEESFDKFFTSSIKEYISCEIEVKHIVKVEDVVIKNEVVLKSEENSTKNLLIDLKPSEYFQIELSNLGYENYFYVFSKTGDEIKQHWPRNTSSNESNMNLSSNSSITIPNRDSVLRFKSKNEELLILASNFELHDSPQAIYQYGLTYGIFLNLNGANQSVGTLSAYVDKETSKVLAALIKISE